MSGVVLKGVSKTYQGGIVAVAAVDLEVGDGELFAVVGPSGSGKSTLLRLVAGLETPTAGEVWIGGRRVDRLSPRDRDVAMVFQNPALFPHLTVARNLGFGLRARGRPRAEVAAKVAAAADRLGLRDVLARRPGTLSGGQRQRVALGRAVVRHPRVFLLDEPLSSLDAPLRAAMRGEIDALHRRLGATLIHVTHDQAEAMALGDRVAVMDRGRILQAGPPADLYASPNCRFVAGFLGNPPMNFLPGLVEPSAAGTRLTLANGPDHLAWSLPPNSPFAAGLTRRGAARIDLGIRPEDIAVEAPPVASAAMEDDDRAGSTPVAEAVVARLEPAGHETIATLSVGPHSLNVRLPARGGPRPGDRVRIRIDLERASWFDPETGVAVGRGTRGCH